jgi:hypothetical protein
MEFKNRKKLNPTGILPNEEQVVITLKTQQEIDQLFAVLNFRPIRNALTDIRGRQPWEPLKKFLKTRDYSHWHARLEENTQQSKC